jgi:3-methyladenine DNA glycosylase/8-oxoguanine DNA glycosylase
MKDAFDMTNEKNEKKALEDDIMKRGNEILLLESRLAQLQKEKGSLMEDLFKGRRIVRLEDECGKIAI